MEEVRATFPRGRIGAPDDPARLIAWLVSDERRWVVGQVIDFEGGFRRSPRWPEDQGMPGHFRGVPRT
jgi:3-oxoacyl-[acyl-carrier protein] reductase